MTELDLTLMLGQEPVLSPAKDVIIDHCRTRTAPTPFLQDVWRQMTGALAFLERAFVIFEEGLGRARRRES